MPNSSNLFRKNTQEKAQNANSYPHFSNKKSISNKEIPSKKLEKRCCPNKKFDFCQKKENTLCSLAEVENFLCQMNKICKAFCISKHFR